jgi:hypothetical protein
MGRERIALACEGAFTGRTLGNVLRPQGLTVDNGSIINRFRTDWDGIVIVYTNGGIGISDLGKEDLNVEENKRIRTLDLLKSEDKTSFLGWAERNNATVFQTQLLASERLILLT